VSKHFTNTSDLVYFSVIRKECATASLSPKQKFRQDIWLMKFLTVRAETLSRTSLYMWRFPPESQVIIELLFENKPVDEDMSGLQSLIMFAGISTNKDMYLENQIINTLYLSDTTNECYERQQNLSDFLYGITVYDVR
jgi:hypothetical protein